MLLLVRFTSISLKNSYNRMSNINLYARPRVMPTSGKTRSRLKGSLMTECVKFQSVKLTVGKQYHADGHA